MQRYQPATREQVEQLLQDTEANISRGHSGKPKVKMTPGRILRSILSFAVVLALVGTLVVLIKTKADGGYPELFGYRIFRVETGSMIPTLPIGTLILVHQPDKPDSLQVGTVITYRYETAVVTHRIVNIEMVPDPVTGEIGLQYATKGDNPDNALDPWTVPPEDILGELIWQFAF